MTAKEVEAQVKQLTDQELRLFANWWDNYRSSLFYQSAETTDEPAAAKAQQVEVLRRLEEIRANPSILQPFDEENYDEMIREIAAEYAQKASAGSR